MAGPAGPGDGMGPISTHLRHVVEVHCNESTASEAFFVRPRLSDRFKRCNSGGRNGTAAVWKTGGHQVILEDSSAAQSCNLRKPALKSSCKIQVSEFSTHLARPILTYAQNCHTILAATKGGPSATGKQPDPQRVASR